MQNYTQYFEKALKDWRKFLIHHKTTPLIPKQNEGVIKEFGKPKAILMISAHWYKAGNLVQKTEHPQQVFDMYGFPKPLYEVEYKPNGCAELSDSVLSIKGLDAKVDNTWGIDHGTWTPLVHMFPGATIPIVQLSVNGLAGTKGCYNIGKVKNQWFSTTFAISAQKQ